MNVLLCCVLLHCRAVIRLLPRLAAFAPERFAQDYLHKCIAHLLAVLKHTGERGTAFAALADMAGSLAAVGCQDGFEPYLPAIAAQVSASYFVFVLLLYRHLVWLTVWWQLTVRMTLSYQLATAAQEIVMILDTLHLPLVIVIHVMIRILLSHHYRTVLLWLSIICSMCFGAQCNLR